MSFVTMFFMLLRINGLNLYKYFNNKYLFY